TPETSFRLTQRSGTYPERALLFAILRRLPELKPYQKALEVAMADYAHKGFHNWAKRYYESEVLRCNRQTKGAYLQFMLEEVSQRLQEEKQGSPLLTRLIEHLEKIKTNNYKLIRNSQLIWELRMTFAQISVDLLKPDFVIMDEFQRFRYLIDSDPHTETGLLTERFFNSEQVRILLLSATPYKMYSTLEEIDELSTDEHYSEFLKVTGFLSATLEEELRFREIWRNYSVKLRTYIAGDTAIVEAKNAAEEALFAKISRTERISANCAADLIDDSLNAELTPTEADIRAYVDGQKLVEAMGVKHNLPVDYVKSSPYLLSFMRSGYKFKRDVIRFFKRNPDQVNLAKSKYLWLERNQIERFAKLEPNNARLKYLEELAFRQNAARLLWVPPSLPYYELSGPFKGTEGFSKFLIFSSWEMVPRMLSTLLSYESERLNATQLLGRTEQRDRTARYFTDGTKKRYPAARMNFNLRLGEPQGMNLFCLLYPAKRLADCFDPVDVLNRRPNLQQLENEIEGKIKELLSELDHLEGPGSDKGWYYLAPMLLDEPNYVREWLEQGKSLAEYEDFENEDEGKKGRGQKGFLAHLEQLTNLLQDPDLNLGRKPADLHKVLTDMVLGSPAICMMRTYDRLGGGYEINKPSQLGKIFINRMNTPESTAVIEVCYGESSDRAHWKNLLRYGKEGNLQAVFDEYAHLILQSPGLARAENRIEQLHQFILESMNVYTASYGVDTFNNFKNRVQDKKGKPVNIRTHFAVAFTKSEGGVNKGENRRKAVRNSFNSPFRPFVLATTSIGQEGLDFHFYCRKVVHWNLPSNPIDLEQREGRINRYKCLAIRENIARRYGHITFSEDIWTEMFDHALRKEKAEQVSELVPFWVITPAEETVAIRRIVPMYAFSRDVSAYRRLIKILAHYRITLGHARQEELLEYLFTNHNEEDLQDLFLNLSPFYSQTPCHKSSRTFPLDS
ncbi:MAG TPA: SWF/SNF helicase family protein, partial [Natronincola sp.]|nr:SWF/SNF helicase family protein [Natronincola sp.]